jgi:enoyl-CoA hydratase/carnithine racemase
MPACYSDAVSLVALSTGKLFSGGLDLGSMRTYTAEQANAFVANVIRLFGRLLGFNCPTLCLVRGAAYAGGCMLAFSFDEIHCYETGTFCCNEVEMGLPLPPGMNAVVQRRMHHPRDVRDMVLYAKKFSAEEGLKIGFVDSIIKENPLTTMHKIAEARAAYSAHRDNFKKLKE